MFYMNFKHREGPHLENNHTVSSSVNVLAFLLVFMTLVSLKRMFVIIIKISSEAAAGNQCKVTATLNTIILT